MNINIINLVKSTALATIILNSLVSLSSHNVNGPPRLINSYQTPLKLNVESTNYNEKSEIPEIASADSPSNVSDQILSIISYSTFNFTDSSQDAIGKLKLFLLSGQYSEIFGQRTIEDVQSNLFAAEHKVNVDGSISQQSHSHASSRQQSSNKDDAFFYASSPDKYTSENCYIVKMKTSVEKAIFEKLSEIFGAIDAKIYKKYNHGFLGYSICFPDNTLPLSLMREIPSIEFIERDLVIKASQIQEDAPWGLARLSSPDPKSSYYRFDGTGSGVTIYVIDSGLEKIAGNQKL